MFTIDFWGRPKAGPLVAEKIHTTIAAPTWPAALLLLSKTFDCYYIFAKSP